MTSSGLPAPGSATSPSSRDRTTAPAPAAAASDWTLHAGTESRFGVELSSVHSAVARVIGIDQDPASLTRSPTWLIRSLFSMAALTLATMITSGAMPVHSRSACRRAGRCRSACTTAAMVSISRCSAGMRRALSCCCSSTRTVQRLSPSSISFQLSTEPGMSGMPWSTACASGRPTPIASAGVSHRKKGCASTPANSCSILTRVLWAARATGTSAGSRGRAIR